MTPTLVAIALAASPAQASPAQTSPAVMPLPPAQVAPPRQRTPGDPFEGFNRRMYRRQQAFDRRVFAPVANADRKVVPPFLRSALRNVFGNLREPVVFLNFLLQHKVGKAVETATRFLINSTLGLGGTMDVARGRGVRLPHRPNGFGDTLGFYGVKPGPYLFLPFVGPTTLRDLLGGQADGLVLPIAVGHPFDRLEYQIPRGIFVGLDQRVESDAELHALLDDAVDPYATLRSVYLQDRAGEIAALKGRRTAAIATPASELGDPLRDPAAASPPASAAPELQDPLADPAPSAAPELEGPLSDPAASPAAVPAAPARR